MDRDFGLTDDQRDVVAAVRTWVGERAGPASSGYEEKHEFPRDLFRQIGEMGLAGIPYEERFGGGGQSFLTYLLVLEEIATGFLSLAVTLSVHHLASFGIHQFGSEELKQRYLPRLFSAEWLGAYALSEASSGSDAASLRTRADRSETGFRLTGSKRFITHGGEAELYLVMARTGEDGPRGISAFAVERGLPGFEFGKLEDKMGWNASPMRELLFEGCEVPAESLVGEEGQGFVIALAALDGGRLGMAACSTGLAQGALDAAIRFARDRRQFGRPVIEFEGLQFMLADMATQIEAARRLYRDAGRGRREAPGRRRRLLRGRVHGQAVRVRHRHAGHHRRGPDPRRVRLHAGLPGRTVHARGEGPPDRGGDESGPAHGDRPEARVGPGPVARSAVTNRATRPLR